MRPFSGPEKLDRTGMILAHRRGCQLKFAPVLRGFAFDSLLVIEERVCVVRC
jgi:hypothetical protein